MVTRFSVLFGCSLLLSAVAIQAARNQTGRPAKPEAAQPDAARPEEPGVAKPAGPPFDESKALIELRRQIAGKETDPAGQVFMSLELLQDIPAGQLLVIMEKGYSRSLGVTCTHCHVPGQWQANDKKEKTAARGMIRLVNTLNNDLLPKIKGLDKDHKPLVNCTTCHRGQVKPALVLQ
jgi:Photosynthetic reaction centre cytochrome C subunit